MRSCMQSSPKPGSVAASWHAALQPCRLGPWMPCLLRLSGPPPRPPAHPSAVSVSCCLQPSQSLLAARGKLEVPPLMRAQMEKTYNESQVGCPGVDAMGCKPLGMPLLAHDWRVHAVADRFCGYTSVTPARSAASTVALVWRNSCHECVYLQMAAVTGGLDGSPVVLIQGPPGGCLQGMLCAFLRKGHAGIACCLVFLSRSPGQLELLVRAPSSQQPYMHPTPQTILTPATHSPHSPSGTGKTKTILGLLSIIMHSAPRGAFASAVPKGGSGSVPTSPTAAAGLPSYVRYQKLSAEKRRRVWMEANPHLLGWPDPR